MGRSLTFTLTLAFISAFANIGGSAQTFTPTYSTTAPTEFDCDTDQVLTIAVNDPDWYDINFSFVMEKYENDVWTEVASTNLFTSPNDSFTNICLDEAGVYRFIIWDDCAEVEVMLNGNVIAEGATLNDEFIVFNTCVNESGTMTVEHDGNRTGTCDDLVDFIARRLVSGNDSGGRACRKENLDGSGRVRDFCPNTCGFEGEGECASP